MLSLIATTALSAVLVHSAPAIDRRSGPGVFMTTDINWQGKTKYFPDVLSYGKADNGCISLAFYPDLVDSVSSFGPDKGLSCLLYTTLDCNQEHEIDTSHYFGPITWPGVSTTAEWSNPKYLTFSDSQAGWNYNDKIISFLCVSSNSTIGK
ncbi:hypothetical protein EXIGLDRAFT_718933 [Exidia glandulosa HHB12029]|uniref:Uncharacterized protein n=1 Tax=Exidia glandulosa HHB12029 TaxID=1314781 RepID=A0A165NSR3_EXIGL|nr:hypothetical protein EXIGLDRAFT_718933 [Exidia glandulosa HHB12029]